MTSQEYPHLEAKGQIGEIPWEWWRVSEKKYEYRIPGTTMTVYEESLPNYGACYGWRCSEHPRAFGGHPAQVGHARRLGDAWKHWKEEHVELREQIAWLNEWATASGQHAHGWMTPGKHLITKGECARCDYEAMEAARAEEEDILRRADEIRARREPLSASEEDAAQALARMSRGETLTFDGFTHNQIARIYARAAEIRRHG